MAGQYMYRPGSTWLTVLVAAPGRHKQVMWGMGLAWSSVHAFPVLSNQLPYAYSSGCTKKHGGIVGALDHLYLYMAIVKRFALCFRMQTPLTTAA